MAILRREENIIELEIAQEYLKKKNNLVKQQQKKEMLEEEGCSLCFYFTTNCELLNKMQTLVSFVQVEWMLLIHNILYILYYL